MKSFLIFAMTVGASYIITPTLYRIGLASIVRPFYLPAYKALAVALGFNFEAKLNIYLYQKFRKIFKKEKIDENTMDLNNLENINSDVESYDNEMNYTSDNEERKL